MRLRWSAAAVRDLGHVRDHIGASNRRAAAAVAKAILVEVNRLPDFPSLGRAGRLAGTRELVVPGLPYVIPYRVRGTDLEILRVVHAARKWPPRRR